MSDEVKRDSVERVFAEICGAIGLERVQSIELYYNWSSGVATYKAVCLIVDPQSLEPLRASIKRGELRGYDDE